MKNRFIYFVITLITFFRLLYLQKPGINFLIFGIFIVAVSSLYFRKKDAQTLILKASLLLSTFSVAWFGDPFSVILSIFIFSILPVFLYGKQEILLFSPIKVFLNYLLGISQIKKPFRRINKR